MNTTEHHPLDSFESALLTELRREVTEHPTLARPPARRSGRHAKLTMAGAVTAAAASVAAVVLIGSGPTASPAFAVTGTADGSVRLAVYRLDDGTGLEAALARHGIDATVRFMSTKAGDRPPLVAEGPVVHDPPGPENPCGIGAVGPGPAVLMSDGGAGGLGANRPKPGDDLGVGGGYSLMFPADSVLFDRPVTIYIKGPGSMVLIYPSSQPGAFCRFGEITINPGSGRTIASSG
jgi:hypothetical protein